MVEFFDMGGYARYVWSAWGISVAVLVITVVAVRAFLPEAREVTVIAAEDAPPGDDRALRRLLRALGHETIEQRALLGVELFVFGRRGHGVDQISTPPSPGTTM